MSISRLRSLWDENGAFHSFNFNALATKFNVVQMITTVVLLGFYHSSLTLAFYWWPVVEGLRVFCLTVARCDVMLKVDEPENTLNEACTRRSLLIINAIGFLWILLGTPFYIAFIPNLGKTTVSIVFAALAAIIFLVRFMLSLPLIMIVCGDGTDFTTHDGVNYERIGDGSAQDLRRSNSSESTNSVGIGGGPHGVYAQDLSGFGQTNASSNLSPDELASIRAALAHEDMEDRQIAQALEASRKESYQSLREEQDEEYRRTLDEHLRTSIAESDFSLANSAVSGYATTLGNETTLGGYDDSTTRGSPEPPFELELDDEPPAGASTVVVRIRLPNGTRCERRFTRYDAIEDVMAWVRVELWQNKSRDICQSFRLVSTMPRTVYDDHAATLEHLKFWHPNAKKECVTPMLYAEEI